VPGRPPSAPNPAGAHFLRDRALIGRLVRASGAGPGRLVLDLGAGRGALTAALSAAGARVIAVERDARLAAGLRQRFDGDPAVRVVEADLRSFPLPRREFLVVASPPFSLTTALCRRLLGDPAVPLAGGQLIQSLALRHVLAQTALPHTSEAADTDRLLNSPMPGPGITGELADWTLAAFGYLAIMDAFTELDPDFIPPDSPP